MRFRNSLRLLMENFKHVYKLLIAKLIIGLVATALCCAFVLPELIEIWNSEAVKGLVENVKDAFTALLVADHAALETIKTNLVGDGGSIEQVGKLLTSMRLEIILTVVGCVVVYLLRRFAETVCHFTTGSMLNDKMSSYAETGYLTAFVSNLGKASVYSLVYVPVIFLFDVAMLALVYLLLAYTGVIFSLFGGVTLIVFAQAFKLTVTSRWMPAMTADNKRLFEAMKYADQKEKKQTSKVFSMYLVSVYMILIVNVGAALCSFGSALLVTIPASYFLLICEQYVNYYTLMGKKYFLTYEQIATNTERGDSEHFFEYLTEETQENVENTDEVKENN